MLAWLGLHPAVSSVQMHLTLPQLTGNLASQPREDYTADDVEQYFNYMGMLAAEVRCPSAYMPGTMGYRQLQSVTDSCLCHRARMTACKLC